MDTTLDPAVERVLFPQRAAAERAALWMRTGAGALSATLDLLFPPHCASCGAALPSRTNTALCLSCAEEIEWIGRDRCRRCGDAVGQGSGAVDECPACRTYPPAFVRSACAVARYVEGPVRRLILGMKFGAKLHLARPLGRLVAARIEATEAYAPDLVVVPAPLTRRALYQRGFNQGEEMAANVARWLKLPLETALLRKIRATPPQAALSEAERRRNPKGAFACVPRVAARYKGRRVLLIDDVITTGSTVSECARTLVGAGIREVHVAALGR